MVLSSAEICLFEFVEHELSALACSHADRLHIVFYANAVGNNGNECLFFFVTTLFTKVIS